MTLDAYRAVLLAAIQRGTTSTETVRGDGSSISNWIDGHHILGDPLGLDAASALVAHEALEAGADCVLGEVAAATSLVAGTVLHALRKGKLLLGRGLRRQPKTHGIQGLFTTSMEGIRRPILVDDVAATGAAGERSVQALRSVGLAAVGLVVLVDREEGARQRLEKLGVPLIALFKLRDLAGGATPRR